MQTRQPIAALAAIPLGAGGPAYLKVFISRQRSKIEAKGGPQYIETERGLGYRFVRLREAPTEAATRD